MVRGDLRTNVAACSSEATKGFPPEHSISCQTPLAATGLHDYTVQGRLFVLHASDTQDSEIAQIESVFRQGNHACQALVSRS